MPGFLTIPILDATRDDPRVLLADLRRKLSVQGDIVSEAGRQRTIDLFGEPLSPKQVVQRICGDVRQNGLSFDLSTSTGKLMRTILAGLAEFERDLIRDRVKSGLAAARARGVRLGRQHGQRPSDKKAKRVLAMHKEGLSV